MKDEHGKDEHGLSRRGFLTAVGGGMALSALLTAGQALTPLKPLGLLAPRLPETGPQGVPVNTTAKSAGVEALVRDPAWRLRVTGRIERELELSLSDLRGMRQRDVELPIACVEGWSTSARWRGVRLKDVVRAAGGRLDRGVRVESLQERSRYRTSEVDRPHLEDDLTLLALEINGEVLNLDHGYPVRLISPSRPGVMQTKWIGEVVVL